MRTGTPRPRAVRPARTGTARAGTALVATAPAATTWAGAALAPVLAFVLALVLAATLAGCAASPAATGPAPGTTGAPVTGDAASPAPAGRITVFAAASLGAVLGELGAQFTEQTGIEVTYSFAGSQDLVAQVLEGAPADVLATANLATMERVATEAPELLDAPAVAFATNTLAIVTAPGNPLGITGWSDLARADLQLVVCAPEVPCGAATAQVEASTGTALDPVSEESRVTDVLAKVVAGEADAGVVYATDARGSSVTAVDCAPCAGARTTYPVATIRRERGSTADAARAYVDFLRSAPAQEVLAGAGFGAP